MTPEVEREVRFAVVIYGGVSLAVYINGVVQEMLNMVRATSPEPGELNGVAQVYRKLGCIVGAGTSKQSEHGSQPSVEDEELEDDIRLVMPPDGQVRTRFVVDILSGTSAGGINAIFLAKALANNQSLDSLARMWLDVADIGKLLNDRGSAEFPVRPQSPPKSLLNSRWMYLKLIEALDKMDDDAGGTPLVNDIDLYSTTTDIDGVTLPLALADREVDERRHRNVFRFRKRGINKHDFRPDRNPFLAFAARCTSAFPFAFEPMALADIFEVIRFLPKHAGASYCKEDTDEWQEFYLDYLRDADPNLTTAFRNRPFGDGGYLDNKPFSYAVDTIMTRHANLPVDRKLIYVEPAPEAPGVALRIRTDSADRPDAVENSMGALVELPRYETIRQDLERVLEWNRNVRRIKRVLRGVDAQLDQMDYASYKAGPSYAFYLRLRRSKVTDELAGRICEVLMLDPRSARGEAIRALTGAWRSVNIVPKDRFLEIYDVDYLRRIIRYLRTRIRRARLDRRGQSRESAAAHRVDRERLMVAQEMLTRLGEAPIHGLFVAEALKRDEARRRDDLQFIVDPRTAARRMQEEDGAMLGATDSAYRARVNYILKQEAWQTEIAFTHRVLGPHFEHGPIVEVMNGEPQRAGGLKEVRAIVLPILERHGGRDRFDVQDSLVFPMTFGTSLGEVDPVEVIRISPRDAKPIKGVDDDRPPGPALKGEKLGAFGGFLDRRWRLHDMLVGRLNAADRLITSVLPDMDTETAAIRESLIKEAQEAIATDFHRQFKRIIEEEEYKHAAIRARQNPQ